MFKHLETRDKVEFSLRAEWTRERIIALDVPPTKLPKMLGEELGPEPEP